MALILSRLDVQHCFTMVDAITAMRTAFSALSRGQAEMPQRLAVGLQEKGLALLMPSLIHTFEEHTFGLKIVTQMPGNSARGLPRSYASVLLLDAVTSKTLAIMEGGWLTAMRTGAASGLATDLLARPDARILALFGAGVQATTQVLALHTVRPLDEVRVVNRSDERYQSLVAILHKLLGATCPPIVRAQSATEALADASLVACATAATAPLFHWSDVAPGTHINAVGAFTPEMCEVDGETLAHARIVVDQREAAMIEAGDLLQPLALGQITGPDTWIELGSVVTGQQSVRQSENDITFFKSVGLGVQDVASALLVYSRAREMGVGMEVDV